MELMGPLFKAHMGPTLASPFNAGWRERERVKLYAGQPKKKSPGFLPPLWQFLSAVVLG